MVDAEKQIGMGLKRDTSYMQLEIDNDIKCLTKVLGVATLSSEGHKEAGETWGPLEVRGG